jgi:hypothetical protein
MWGVRPPSAVPSRLKVAAPIVAFKASDTWKNNLSKVLMLLGISVESAIVVITKIKKKL